MNILTFILPLLKTILGMKFGVLLLVVFGIVIGGSILRNILTGSFNIAKFVGGFNLFAGPVQGKLIYYGVVFLIASGLALGIYGKMTQETYSNDYRNNVRAENVTIDQKQIIEGNEDTMMVGIKLFGLKIGITYKGKPKPREVINNAGVTETKPKVPVAPKVQKKK